MNGRFVKMTSPMQAHIALRNRKVICYKVDDAVAYMYSDKKRITTVIQDFDGKNPITAIGDFGKLTKTLNDLKKIDFYIYECGDDITALPSSVINEFVNQMRVW